MPDSFMHHICINGKNFELQDKAAREDIRLIKTTSSWVGTSGNRPEIRVVKNGTGITVEVPNRLLYICDGKVTAYDGTAAVYELRHNEVLYFSLDNKNLNVIPHADLSSITDEYIILAYANNGKCLGQWSRYQVYEEMDDLKDDILDLTYNTIKPFDGVNPLDENDFTRGTINNGIPVSVSTANRCYSRLIHFPYDVRLFPSSTYRVYVWQYDDADESNPEGLGWKTEPFTFDTLKWYRIVIAKRTEDSEQADIAVFVGNIFLTSYASSLIKYQGITIVPRGQNPIIFSRDVNSYTLKIRVPYITLMFYASNNTDAFKTINTTTDAVWTLSANQVLAFDAENYEYKVISQDSFIHSAVKKYILLVWNHQGHPKGQWEKYFVQQLERTKWHGFKCINRQGQIDGNEENSITGLIRAHQLGYDIIRISIIFTADGIPVLSHGTTVTIDGNIYTIYQTNYSIISSAVTSLNDALTVLQGTGCIVVLECKNYSMSVDKLESAIAIVSNHGMLDKVMWATYDKRWCEAIIAVHPYASVGIIGHITDVLISDAISIKTSDNDITLHLYVEDMSTITTEQAMRCHLNGIKIKVGGSASITLSDAIAWNQYVDYVEFADVWFPYDSLKLYSMSEVIN